MSISLVPPSQFRPATELVNRAALASRPLHFDGTDVSGAVRGVSRKRPLEGYTGHGPPDDPSVSSSSDRGGRDPPSDGTGVWIPGEPSPAGRSGRGTLGAPGVNWPVNKSRPIYSHFRTSPIPYQLSIVTLCSVQRPSEQWAERSARAVRFHENELLAPVGTENCHKAHKGELVYELINNDGTPQRDINEYDGYKRVFACVNGLTIFDRIKFSGFMAFNQNASHPDEVGTLQIAGTCTVTHTGPHKIHAGQIVYFSPYPYIRFNDYGKKEPAIWEVGIPGQTGEKDFTGVSLAKFKPALYGLVEQDTAAFIRSVEKSIDKLLKYAIDGSPGKANDLTEQRLTELAEQVRSTRFLYDPPLFPMRLYAEVYLWRKAFSYASNVFLANASTTERELARAFYRVITRHYSALQTASMAFRDALGSPMTSYAHMVLEPATSTEIMDDKYFGVNEINGGVNYIRNPELFRETGLTISTLLLEWSRTLLQFYQADQDDFLKSHCIGTAMRDAMPGHMLDIMIAFYMR